jgi:hypothetical protein
LWRRDVVRARHTPIYRPTTLPHQLR